MDRTNIRSQSANGRQQIAQTPPIHSQQLVSPESKKWSAPYYTYYARAVVDNTMLVALGTISSAMSKGTDATMKAVTHLLNYCATHLNATVRFTKSGMILRIHSDASYLSEPNARSRVGGYFFLDGKGDPDPKV
jgi:hypothetical protein